MSTTKPKPKPKPKPPDPEPTFELKTVGEWTELLVELEEEKKCTPSTSSPHSCS